MSQSYIIIKDPLGKYIKVKLRVRDGRSNQEILIAITYIEQKQDSNPQFYQKTSGSPQSLNEISIKHHPALYQ